MYLRAYLFLLLLFAVACEKPGNSVIFLEEGSDGWRLMVNEQPLIINGMNWDYFPIGTNYEYILWEEQDEFIKEALDYEMGLLKNMGVNAIRVYTGIQAKWIEYIYDNFGIYTMLNHPFGRYGYSFEGDWIPATDYADDAAIEVLLTEVEELALQYKDTPGLLLYLLGNENNYGLFWSGAETEDIPEVNEEYIESARAMYRLFNKGALAIRSVDPEIPVAICNGDLLFLDLIIEECPDIDILGINVYRGKSFTDLYDRVKKEYGKPVLLTEFGSDAFNAITQEEAQEDQAIYNVANWREIYENAAGLGKAGNSIGGFTFQFSDGWWKYGQTHDLDVHNTEASWENGGYEFDHIPGKNNMNEEWFGICAKGPTNDKGFYELFPRAAYFAIKQAHQINPYAPDISLEQIRQHFDEIDIELALTKAELWEDYIK
ncbi:MAG: hypothetical protein EA409_11050 [Saprospirales bacterium]|nr:MAG: hypothetical protein EA409_11050 [Saprospirales bacterium]